MLERIFPLFRRRLYESEYESKLDTDETIVAKYNILLHLRHDLIHYLVNEVLYQPQEFTKHLSLESLFEDILPEHFCKYSPDIFFSHKNKIFFLDVSCSHNFEYNLNEKKLKYNPILEYFESRGFPAFPFYFFWVLPDWSNLESSLEKLYKFCIINDITFARLSANLVESYMLFFEQVNQVLNRLKNFIPDTIYLQDLNPNPATRTLDRETIYQKCRKNYPHWDKTQELLSKTTIEESERIFNEMLQEEGMVDVFRDEPYHDTVFERSFTHLLEVERLYPKFAPKPTFFIPYAGYNSTIVNAVESMNNALFSGLKVEQKQCLQFLAYVCKIDLNVPGLTGFLKGLNASLLECLEYPGEKRVFNTGMLTGDLDKEIELTKLFKEHNSKDSSVSKRTFFKNMLGNDDELKDRLPYIYRNKCIKLESHIYRHSEFVRRSGTSYRKTHEVREYKEKTTVNMDVHKSFEKFMDLLETSDQNKYGTHQFLGNFCGVDSEEANNIKAKMFKCQREFLGELQDKHVHSFSRHSSLVANQLLHFGELNTTDNSFYIFNAGRINTLHVVQGGSKCRGDDVGQAFFTIFLTNDLAWASNVYGNVTVQEIFEKKKKMYLCVTPWVRLTSEKLNFMKDQYYSTLSTAYDSWSRNKKRAIFQTLLRHVYTFRVCVSLAPSQKIAELLMDTRYIFMAALSEYTNVELLIREKFAPPYKNCMEQFIIRQLQKKCPQISAHLQKYPPKPAIPGYAGSKRMHSSLGGSISIPSLWSDYILHDMQSIFDDIFVYVHTSKEPSSEHHEQVKAMNTILKFQAEYNEMDEDSQAGFPEIATLKKWLKSRKQVGCSSKVIYGATLLFAQNYKGIHKTTGFRVNVTQEPLSNMTSTKACIPELDRHTVEIEHNQSQMERIIKNMGSLFKERPLPHISKTFFKIDTEMENTNLVISQTNRVKVHDALLDWLTRFGRNECQNYVMDLAIWNILENNCRVSTDTCIKAQYGAKREFYVVNLGAKAMMRVVENSYKEIAKRCYNEMISVPGDRKFEHIQRSIDESIQSSTRRQDTLMYVNGDCSKWSACETMASFIAMNSALRDVLGNHVVDFNNLVYTSWANKTIHIPRTILENLRFKSQVTEYVNQDAKIHSTQNFLQGMCNVASSLKAVISTDFALHMFRKNYPGVFISCCHLEHSDDYSLAVRTKNNEDFEKFRVYHRLSQKLFGINDSIKKTNVQKHILEFISLFSYNGQLFYPNIKKLKEVGTNLSCTDFRSDVMSISSRVSEAVRLGISLESCYFMQRVHCCTIADAYSVTPGMRNAYGTAVDCFSQPLELFGLPDTLPFLTPLVKGNLENYRLYNFGNPILKRKLFGLYKMGLSLYDSSDLPGNFKEDLGELYSPTFSYPVRHNKIKRIRESLDYSWEDSIRYIDDNLTDTLIKPVDTNRLKIWLKAMYFNKSFSKAYTKMSRASASLRHSTFSSKPCILSWSSRLSPDDERYYLTVKSFLQEMDSEILGKEFVMNSTEIKNFDKMIKCYNNSLDLFYDVLNNSKIVNDTYVNHPTTVAKIPSPYSWISLENNITLVLQYLINPKNFFSDRRMFKSETSLARDIETINKSFNIPLLKTSRAYCRQVFKEILSQGKNSAYGLVYDPNNLNPVTFCIQYFQYSLFTGCTFKVLPKQKLALEDFNRNIPIFLKDWKTNTDTYTNTLHQLALIYRAIELCNTVEEKQSAFEKLLSTKLIDTTVTVSEFLCKVTVSQLQEYHVGELGQKILTFLQSRLLNNYTGLTEYIQSKFFYEATYLKGYKVEYPFSEQANISFLGISYVAYRYTQSQDDYILLKMPYTNKVHWFYCYSIAERVFGKISQTMLDERLMESRDFSICKLPAHLTFLLNHICCPSDRTTYYKKMGNVILEKSMYEDADIPILTTRFVNNTIFNEKIKFDAILNISTNRFDVTVGNIVVFKLPFGNLRNEINCLDPCDASCEGITINGVSMLLLLKPGRLIKFLKNDFTNYFKVSEIEENIEHVWSSYRSLANIDDILDYKPIFLPETPVVYSRLEFKPIVFEEFKVDPAPEPIDVSKHAFTPEPGDKAEIMVERPRERSLELDSLSESLASNVLQHPVDSEQFEQGFFLLGRYYAGKIIDLKLHESLIQEIEVADFYRHELIRKKIEAPIFNNSLNQELIGVEEKIQSLTDRIIKNTNIDCQESSISHVDAKRIELEIQDYIEKIKSLERLIEKELQKQFPKEKKIHQWRESIEITEGIIKKLESHENTDTMQIGYPEQEHKASIVEETKGPLKQGEELFLNKTDEQLDLEQELQDYIQKGESLKRMITKENEKEDGSKKKILRWEKALVSNQENIDNLQTQINEKYYRTADTGQQSLMTEEAENVKAFSDVDENTNDIDSAHIANSLSMQSLMEGLNFELKSSLVDVIESVDNLNIFSGVSTIAGQSFELNDETVLKMVAMDEYKKLADEQDKQFYSLSNFTEIEETRAYLHLGDIEDNQFGELFQPLEQIEFIQDTQDSSSSSSSEEGLVYIQLVPQQKLAETTWNFESRMREQTTNLPEYLLNCWTKLDLMNILEKQSELQVLFRALVLISQNIKTVKLTKKQRCVVQVTLNRLREYMTQGINRVWKISPNKGVTIEKGRFVFKALRGYLDEDTINSLSNTPKVQRAFLMNSMDDATWFMQTLKDKDMVKFVKTEIEMEFTNSTPFAQMLSTILPAIKLIPTELEDDYDF